MIAPSARVAGLALLMGLAPACSAVYPEVRPPMHAAAHQKLDPPPSDMHFVAFLGGSVPQETRDGRKWDAIGGEAPDPYAVLFVNGRELFRTTIQANTLKPTWPDAPRGNYAIEDGDKLRVELWDSNPVNDHPIGVKDLGRLGELIRDGNELDVACESGAHVRLMVEPAHAEVGLGFYYELRNSAAFVTKVFPRSPAARAGIAPGDELVALAGRPVNKLSSAEVQSTINAPVIGGLPMVIRHSDGRQVSLKLQEGAVYLTAGDLLPPS